MRMYAEERREEEGKKKTSISPPTSEAGWCVF